MLKRRLKEPFGKAGLTVAILALVLAMVGGAYAAGGLTKPQEKQVTKIAKKYAGKPGAPGANGTNGTNGSPGTAGAAGAPGAAGTSVTNAALAKGSVPCPEGGAEFKVGAGAATKACNGTTGFTKTLPSGETETGAWGFTSHAAGYAFETYSFPIPLKIALEAEDMHFILPNGKEFLPNEEEGHQEATQTVCLGSAEEPKAVEGNLCVYEQELTAEFKGIGPIGTSGASAIFNVVEPEGILGKYGKGSWAVTAPE